MTVTPNLVDDNFVLSGLLVVSAEDIDWPPGLVCSHRESCCLYRG